MKTPVSFLVVAACLLQASPLARGQWTLQTMVPRVGYFQVQVAGGGLGPSVEFLTTDSDEALKTATAPLTLDSSNSFAIHTGSSSSPAFTQPAVLEVPAAFGGPPTSSVPFTGDTITQPPHNLDAANWAFAIGLRNGGALKAFFQMRLAGSSAAVLDPTLAAEAVAAGLWSGANDYFEFPSGHAGIDVFQFPANGPEDYYSYAIPEPASAPLLTAAAAALSALRRRRKA